MKTGLVLEGGAFRGVFTSGVLDVMQQRQLGFDYCIGVSAGAGNAMNFKSRQPERAYRLVAEVEPQSYYGLRQARKTGDYINLNYLYDTLSTEGNDRFDFTAYYKNPMVCEYVVSCCETGKAEYLQENVSFPRLAEIVKASCAMPGLCRPREIDGKHYLDGGVADALPVRRALEQGCQKVVLVTTKPTNNLHPTDYTRLRPLLSRMFEGKYPVFFESLMNRVERYFASLEDILQLEKEGRIFVIRPQRCNIKTLEKDMDAVRRYYQHGRFVAQQCYDALLSYLKK